MRFPAAPWSKEFRQSSLSEITQDTIALLGEPSISGERVSIDGSLRLADVFAAVNIIAGTVATLPLKVYREIGTNVEEQPAHRMWSVLGQRPNPSMPAHTFWQTVAGHLLLWGNAFIEKLRGEDGLVSELWLVHPSLVTVEWNASLRQKRYVLENAGQKAVYSDERLLHIMGYSTDGLYGLSPIQQCRQQLGLAKARERFEGEVYGQKPYLSGVIEHPGRIKSTVKLRESWAAIYGGGNRLPLEAGGAGRHGVAVLEEGASFHPVTAPLEDMQFVEAQRLSRETIANIFRLPLPFLNGSISGSLVYQTPEMNQIHFARNCITPITTNIQKYVSYDLGLFPFGSWYAEFSLGALLRGDSGARAEYYKALSEVKAITPNEIRGLENMPPLTPAEEEKLNPAPPPSLVAPNMGADEDDG